MKTALNRHNERARKAGPQKQPVIPALFFVCADIF
jgi:hypothetical protein